VGAGDIAEIPEDGMTLAISTVCSSIAALDMGDIHVCDLHNVPPVGTRLTPILFPDPANPLGNFVPASISFGGGSSRLMDCDYDLNYMFVYCEIGAGRTGLDYLEKCMEAVQDIYDAVLSIDTIDGAVDIIPNPGVQITTVSDPGGKNFLGCSLSFHVKEFWR
jgi:hypothetical protein